MPFSTCCASRIFVRVAVNADEVVGRPVVGRLHARGETGRVARAEDLAGRGAAEPHLKPGVGGQQLGKIQPDGVGDVLLDQAVPLRAGVGAARIVPLINKNSDCHKNITSPDSLCDAA